MHKPGHVPPKYFLVGVLILCGVLVLLEQRSKREAASVEQRAYQTACQAVKEELEKPDTAKFDDSLKWLSHHDEKFTVQLALDTQGPSGSPERRFYFVRLDDDLKVIKVLQIDRLTDDDMEPLRQSQSSQGALDPMQPLQH